MRELPRPGPLWGRARGGSTHNIFQPAAHGSLHLQQGFWGVSHQLEVSVNLSPGSGPSTLTSNY